MLGPFTDTSGVFVSSLGTTLTQSRIMLSKNGTPFAAKNETTTASQRADFVAGYYSAMLDNTDTGSLGRLMVATTSLAALPVWHEFTVLPSNEYDYVITGSSGLWEMKQANVFAVDMSSLTATVNARSPINAWRALRNRITTSGGIMSVFAENDSTAVWTATLTTNASADPIVESDPA
jgi:hypothetical protein